MLTLAASAGNAIAMGLGGIVAVLAVCAVFYAIGRGEDRDRASAPPASAPDAAPTGAPSASAPAAAPPATAPDQPPAEPPPERAAEERAAPHASPPRPRSPGGGPRRRRP